MDLGRELVAVALVAVLVFWMVGAYNRLTALRYAIGEAFARVDEALGPRHRGIETLVQALASPLSSEAGSLQALQRAAHDVQAAASGLRQQPAAAAAASHLAATESVLSAALSRVQALVATQADLAADPAVAGTVQLLAECQARIAFGRQLFNSAVALYNEAARQFPTRIVARLFSLQPAAPI